MGEGNAKGKAKKEAAAKKAAKDKLAAEEKESKLAPTEVPTCDPGQCLDGTKCKDTDDTTGPFMCADLVSCCKTAPAVAPYSGMSWANIPPPPPPPPVVPSAKCVSLKKECDDDAKCKPLLSKDWVKSTEKAGCQKSKKLLDLWFAVSSECPYPKYPGFNMNIKMWKQQIDDMPEYKDTGTTGRFKASRGAGKKKAAAIAAAIEKGAEKLKADHAAINAKYK